jgi:hypothetical protein
MLREARQSNLVIKPTVREDCIKLAETLRKEDLEEISHASGLAPQESLLYSLAVSERCYTVWFEDEIVLIFGCGGVEEMYGCPWMLASDRLLDVKRDFVRDCRRIVDAMLIRFRYLENYVWAGNKIHIHWLKWLGFTIEPATPFGINGEPFHKFYMTR